VWCPSCAAEYRPGFTRCPDCETDLVVEAPPEPEPYRRIPGEIDLEDLGPAPEVVFVGPPPEADLMRAVLEGSGIACVVWRSGLEHSYGAIWPHRVLVREDVADRASEVIRAARAGELDLDAAPNETDPFEGEEADDGWLRPREESSMPTQTGPIVERARPVWVSAALSIARVLVSIAVLFAVVFFVLDLVEG
jgi:hypothetical protein